MCTWYCDVFIHRNKALGAKKLGERGKLVKFLGYPENISGYRTYNPMGRKVEIVWAPIFQEEAQPTPNVSFETSPSDSETDIDDTTSTPASPLLPHDCTSPLATPPPPAPTPTPNASDPRPQHV